MELLRYAPILEACRTGPQTRRDIVESESPAAHAWLADRFAALEDRATPLEAWLDRH